jgi:hypothetical protein
VGVLAWAPLAGLPPDGGAAAWGVVTAARRLAVHAAVASVYVCAHACVIMVQVITLNVALNSKNNAMLPLLVSNNFVELKSSVFKRIEAENLFQIACADAVERFQLVTYLFLIAMYEGLSWSLLWAMALVFLFELVVDMVKHSFISKFNRLHADLYKLFRSILAHDTLSIRSRWAHSLDPTHAGVRRLGLATLPVAVVVLRMTSMHMDPAYLPRLTSPTGIVAILLIGLVLLCGKLLLSMRIVAVSARLLQQEIPTLAAAVSRARPAVLSAGSSASGDAVHSPRQAGGPTRPPAVATGSGVPDDAPAPSTPPAATDGIAAGVRRRAVASTAPVRGGSGSVDDEGDALGSPFLRATPLLVGASAQARAGRGVPPLPPIPSQAGVRGGSGGNGITPRLVTRLLSQDRYTLSDGSKAVPT